MLAACIQHGAQRGAAREVMNVSRRLRDGRENTVQRRLFSPLPAVTPLVRLFFAITAAAMPLCHDAASLPAPPDAIIAAIG